MAIRAGGSGATEMAMLPGATEMGVLLGALVVVAEACAGVFAPYYVWVMFVS